MRQTLGIGNDFELENWLSQDWVVMCYADYAQSFLDDKGLLERAIQIDSGELHYYHYKVKNISWSACLHIATHTFQVPQDLKQFSWAKDDLLHELHQIRFITRLTLKGLQSNGWQGETDLSELYAKAYRVAA